MDVFGPDESCRCFPFMDPSLPINMDDPILVGPYCMEYLIPLSIAVDRVSFMDNSIISVPVRAWSW
jgi:hypothetical protein